MRILGIESSCDDFAVALLDSDTVIFSEVVRQHHSHGVFPEHASRMHAKSAWNALRKVPGNYDAVAVTTGPGLVGSLRVGITIAKTLCWTQRIPLIAVNHINAHILTPVWSTKTEFPYMALVVSGGHTLLAVVRSTQSIQIIGSTVDDAAGEALDKIARMLGLPYPGGPELEKLALLGTPRFSAPVPMQHHSGYNFSFSGLKEHFRRLITQNLQAHTTQDIRADWAASVQQAVSSALVMRTRKALRHHPEVRHLAIAGGVAANNKVRSDLVLMAERLGVTTHFPPHAVCGDNAEMIAWCGRWKLERGETSDLSVSATPRYKDSVA